MDVPEGGRDFCLLPDEKMLVSIDIACRTLAYYDVANLAQKIKVLGFYSYGYNDNTCPPTTVTAALNVITAPKTIVVTPVSAHWRFEETNRKSIEWMKKRIN